MDLEELFYRWICWDMISLSMWIIDQTIMDYRREDGNWSVKLKNLNFNMCKVGLHIILFL